MHRRHHRAPLEYDQGLRRDSGDGTRQDRPAWNPRRNEGRRRSVPAFDWPSLDGGDTDSPFIDSGNVTAESDHPTGAPPSAFRIRVVASYDEWRIGQEFPVDHPLTIGRD